MPRPQPVPVINWHGCNGHYPLMDYHMEISKVKDAAMDHGYYAITPLGTEILGTGQWGWNTDGILCGGLGVDDFAFLEAILDFASTDLCVDTDRIYSTGFSTGAFLTYGAACRYPSLLAAVSTDAGSLSRSYVAGEMS
jgi:polyhydroxybutyrate depolymerase